MDKTTPSATYQAALRVGLTSVKSYRVDLPYLPDPLLVFTRRIATRAAGCESLGDLEGLADELEADEDMWHAAAEADQAAIRRAIRAAVALRDDEIFKQPGGYGVNIARQECSGVYQSAAAAYEAYKRVSDGIEAENRLDGAKQYRRKLAFSAMLCAPAENPEDYS